MAELSRIYKKAEDGINKSKMQSFKSKLNLQIQNLYGELNLVINWRLKYLKQFL